MSNKELDGIFIKKTVIWLLFAAYAAVAMVLLFFMRSSLLGYCTYRQYYFMGYTNFVPFRTVVEFIGYIRDRDEVYEGLSFDNLLGNLILFMPAGIFFPAIWKKQRRFRTFALTIAAVIIGVEAVQFITMRGACDIDDFILNFFGAVIGFTLSRNKIIKKLTFLGGE